MNMLARREQSRAELAQKLKQRFSFKPIRHRRFSADDDDSFDGDSDVDDNVDAAQDASVDTDYSNRKSYRNKAFGKPYKKTGTNKAKKIHFRANDSGLGRFTDNLESADAFDTEDVSCIEPDPKQEAQLLAETIEAVLDRLHMQGLQCDERFAESYARSRYLRGDGPMKARASMQQKGLSSLLIQRSLNDEKFDWFLQASKVYLRKFGDNAVALAKSDPKVRAKQQRFMASRGFTTDQLRAAMDS